MKNDVIHCMSKTNNKLLIDTYSISQLIFFSIKDVINYYYKFSLMSIRFAIGFGHMITFIAVIVIIIIVTCSRDFVMLEFFALVLCSMHFTIS